MRWGPQPAGDGRWRFGLWAPALETLTLELEGRDPLPMRSESGWFSAEAEAKPSDRYRFRISPDLAVPDPASRAQADDVHSWSLIVDHRARQWRCEEWQGRPWEEAVIYEAHAGLSGGFGGLAKRLPELADLGITAVQLMPIADFYGQRNWGYDGVLPYAPDAAYGTPEELKVLVDRAHELGLLILLDVVYNHFGPEGNYLHAYAPGFFDDAVQTPWGAAIAFRREPVRRFFIDNALMWLHDYRFDGLRFDAVHAIADAAFLGTMATELRASVEPGRQVHLILENEHNDAARLEGDYDAQWNDDFHNVVHVLLTGETSGYYGAFASKPAEKLARCLREGFVYQGECPPGSHTPRGSPSSHLPPIAFVSFLQNHDQIGNRALGERLTLLTDPARLRAATALLLLSPQIPLIFMGDETGSRSPFLFFTDFHDELAEAVREGRRREFAGFPTFSDPESRKRIPDPNAQETFEQSRPQPGPDAEEWQSLYRELLAIRHREIAPHLKEAKAIAGDAVGEGAVTGLWRFGDRRLTIFTNLGIRPVQMPRLPASEPLFALGDGGAPGAFAAWIEA